MTAILTYSRDKDRAVDLLNEVLKVFVFHGLNTHECAVVLQHLADMRQSNQVANLNVNAKLETVPELQLTRLTLEFAHRAIPPVKPQH